jgi:hypothetical protein
VLPTKEIEEYIDNARLAINFFLKCHQWDGLTRHEVDCWLENFSDTLEGQYYSIRLLNQLLYYSERDMENLLREGIFHRVLGKKVLLEHQLSKNFKTSQQELEFEFTGCLEKALFVPLLDSCAPHESGNQISRILVNRLGVKPQNVIFTQNITSLHVSYENLIIVDDYIGSGNQCRDFWTNATVNDGTPLRVWCSGNQVEPSYVALIGYVNSLHNLSNELPDLSIYCIETLQDEYRVFGKDTIYWSDDAEREDAIAYFKSITDTQGIPLFGYNELDFALIMHQNIPDWSLPLFWKGTTDWPILMRRKNSYE